MVSEKKLASAARVALTQCLGIEEGEKLLIVSNPEMSRISEALYREGVKLKAETALLYYPKGTINGEGNYRFMLWAGAGAPDTFRIRIWEEDDAGTETEVYDNGFDQAIDGGSIVVHTKK